MERNKETRLGLVSVSFRKQEPEEILSAMKRAGLSCIEWGSDIHAPKNDRRRLEKLKKLQEQYGICCCSYGTYFRLGVTPLEELEGYIEAAQLLGTKILRLWCGDKNPEEYTKEERNALFHQCAEAARIARQRKVILCMECHIQTYTHTKEAALELMEDIDPEVFRMYWQPEQFRTLQENVEYAELLSPYIEHVHVFNWNGDAKLPLQDGVADWQAYMNRLQEGRTLLLEFMPDDRLESLEREAEALRTIAGVGART